MGKYDPAQYKYKHTYNCTRKARKKTSERVTISIISLVLLKLFVFILCILSYIFYKA